MDNENFELCPQKDKCTFKIMTDLFKRMDELIEGIKLTPKEWKIHYRLYVL